MNERHADILARFVNGPTTADRWTAARELMAARQLVLVADTSEFIAGFNTVGEEVKNGSGIARLVALDLIVRVSSFIKKLKPAAEDLLRAALTHELPPASLLGESKALPEAAKPAEFRENVAIALKHASGDWVVSYIIRTLVEEEKSQRCRLELARQLAAREPSIDRWLSWIVALPLNEIIHPEANLENAATRLRYIAAALANAVKQNRVRLTVSESVGPRLAELCRLLVPVPPRSSPPKRLRSAAAEIAGLLDEIFAVRLTLIAEPEAYTALGTFEQWWQPLPYPKQLRDALIPITDKLVTGITLRARAGQKSENLAVRLRQSFGERDSAAQRLRQIAEEEFGFAAEIDDWLRGRSRVAAEATSALASSLRAVSNEDLTEAIASLLLDAEKSLAALPGKAGNDNSRHLRHLANAVKSLASQRGLEIVGKEGDIVEYMPLAHQTASGRTPADPKVAIVCPMVVRRRRDGSEDLIIRAIVTEVQPRVEG